MLRRLIISFCGDLVFQLLGTVKLQTYSSVVQDVLEAVQKRPEAMGDVRREQKLGEVSPFVGPVDKRRAVQEAQTRQVSPFVGHVDKS